MIINPTHEITLTGLPSDVLDAYVRYKKGSRAIVAWLVQFGPARYKSRRTLPIKELAALARRVASDIKQLPDVIHFHFRETIAARRCLSRYFRENRDQSPEEFNTVNHEHFTNSLTVIYDDLRQQCLDIKAKSDNSNLQTEQVKLSYKLKNHYDCLPVEDTGIVEDAMLNLGAECADCEDDVLTSCASASTMSNGSMQLEADEMTNAIETTILLNQVQIIYEAVALCWGQAGRGETSFISAAAITNTAWTSLRYIETRLKVIHPNMDVRALRRTTCMFESQSHDSVDMSCNTEGRALLNALEESEQSVRHYVDGHELKVIPSCASCVPKPADYVQLLDNVVGISDTRFQVALLDNMLHLINRAGSCPTLILNSTPCLAEIGYSMSHLEQQPDIFHSVLAMRLLAVSYQAYLTACAKPSMVSLCRISALKLANQAVASIEKMLADKHAFPCQCPQTLAFHLSNLQHDLQAYGKYNCWDLYFQSPWIAGTHTIEMLDMLSYYGMRLFHYRHYVGALLHTYNVVRQLGGLERISVLDQLCDLFQDVFFPAGGRPMASFRNSWSRFVGARLKFKRGHRGHGQRESWCMAVPAHAARTAAGFGTNPTKDRLEPKFNYGRIDPLIQLKQQGYRLEDALVDLPLKHSVPCSSHSRQSTSSSTPSLVWAGDDASDCQSSTRTDSRRSSSVADEKTAPSSSKSQHPLLVALPHLGDAMSGSSSACFPTSRLNLLAIFNTALSLVSRISTRTHTSVEEKETKNCICFTTTLLSGADRIVAARKLGKLEVWRKDEREVVEIVKDVLVTGLEGIEKDEERKEWLWQI